MKALFRFIQRFRTDILYRNSLYLMIGSGILTGFGFFFWTICAKLYSANDVGLATTVISAMNLIASLASLGLGIALVRYLPTSKDKSTQINSCMTVTFLASVIFASVFVAGLSFFSPKLIFIKENIFLAIVFISIVAFQSVANLFERVFVALRDAKHVITKNMIFSLLKLVFPFFLVAFGAFGIFGSWGLSLFFSIIFSIVLLMKRFSYRPAAEISYGILKKIFGFTSWNYIANLINMLPGLVLPLLITQYMTPADTAYYYVALMIASLLFVIPIAISSSLFAEGSFNISLLKKTTNKASRLTAILLIPSMIVLSLSGRFLLGFFGEDYASEGTQLLFILNLSAIPQAFKGIYLSVLNVEHRMLELILVNIVISIGVIGFSLLMIKDGLLGLGIAWLLGQLLIFPLMGIFRALHLNRH